MDDNDLLDRYRRQGDHEAFAELVHRHADWIYASARRQLGDAHLAEDATQAVFLLLARKAARLSPRSNLGGWLFGALRYCIKEAQRHRSRQQHHEKEAAQMRQDTKPGATWDAISPLLDSAIARLGNSDREAILLRFYQRKPLADVGRALGTTEEAARKRVDRAVDKLRQHLAACGVHAETAGLSAIILTHVAEDGPAGLAGQIAASITQGMGGAAAGGIAKGAWNMMAWAKAKAAAAMIAGAAVMAGGSVVVGQLAVQPAARTASAAGVPATSPAEDAEAFHGTWRMVSGADGGRPAPPEEIADVHVLITAETVTVMRKGQLVSAFSYTRDPNHQPKWIDLSQTAPQNSGRTNHGIYELTGNTLRLCTDESGKGRSTAFVSEPNSVNDQLWVLQKQQGDSPAAATTFPTQPDPLVQAVREMDGWIQQERNAARIRIDLSSAQAFDVATADTCRGAATSDLSNRTDQATTTVRLGRTTLVDRVEFYDRRGRSIPFTIEDRQDNNTGFYRLQFADPVPPGGSFQFLLVADVPIAKQLRQDGKLWYFMPSNGTPNCLNYYQVILPPSAVFVDCNLPVVATKAIAGRTSVIIRNYTGSQGDGTAYVAFLWPDKDGSTAADLPPEYRGLRDERVVRLAEEYRSQMARILAGEQYEDQSTPLAALLTLNCAIVNKDEDAVASACYSSDRSPRSAESNRMMIDTWREELAEIDVLTTPAWPDRPKEGYIHPIEICRRGSLIRIDTYAVIYSQGKWRFRGNQGNRWSTDVSVFEKLR